MLQAQTVARKHAVLRKADQDRANPYVVLAAIVGCIRRVGVQYGHGISAVPVHANAALTDIDFGAGLIALSAPVDGAVGLLMTPRSES